MVVIQVFAGLLLAGGIAYLSLALYRLGEYRPDPAKTGRFTPPASVMVPVCGLTPRLEECLSRLCAQDYPAYQVVFGLHSPDDPAKPLIERIMAAHPGLDTRLVVNSRRIGANPKNCNLANMLPATRYDVLVMVDADVLVEPDFLRGIVAPLAVPGVGGATCLYTGEPEPNLASRLCALFINEWFVPSALVDVTRHEMDICYGAAIAVTRVALDAIGGFAPMANAVAQDYVFGHELRRTGFTIRLAPCAVRTVVAEPSLARMFAHELRWNRAVRAVRPLDHALSVFLHPLAPATALLLATWPWRWAVAPIACYLALKLALHGTLRKRFPLPAASPLWLPVRETVNFLVWTTALMGRKVRWGDQILATDKGLSMHKLSVKERPD